MALGDDVPKGLWAHASMVIADVAEGGGELFSDTERDKAAWAWMPEAFAVIAADLAAELGALRGEDAGSVIRAMMNSNPLRYGPR